MKRFIIVFFLLFATVACGSQQDFDISTTDANTGTTFRAAINSSLQALASNSSGATAPSTTYAYQFWVDTSTTLPTLKQRNAANTGWVSLFQLSTSQWTFVNDVVINGLTVGAGGGSDYSNSVIGYYSLLNNTGGNYNVALGLSTLMANTTGAGNVAVGAQSLFNIGTVNYNTALGYRSGRYVLSGSNNTSSSSSVFIGYDARPSADGNTNEIVIGSTARGNGSNTATLGNDSITETILKGRLKLNTVPTDYADNAAALAGGLVSGETYRTGDVLKVVR
jgi:hypothetical protein